MVDGEPVYSTSFNLTHCFTTALPHYRTAALPHRRTAALPHWLTAALVLCREGDG